MSGPVNEEEAREVLSELVKVASKYGWVIALPPSDDVEFIAIGKESVLRENILCDVDIYSRDTMN